MYPLTRCSSSTQQRMTVQHSQVYWLNNSYLLFICVCVCVRVCVCGVLLAAGEDEKAYQKRAAEASRQKRARGIQMILYGGCLLFEGRGI